MAVDLTKGSTIWSFYGKLVDPFNLDVEYERVDVGRVSLSYNLYTDERVTGSLSAPPDFPITNNRLLRIYAEIESGTDYQLLCLGTFFMRHRKTTSKGGMKQREVELHSTLWRHMNDFQYSAYYLPPGGSPATYLTAIVQSGGGTVRISGGMDVPFKEGAIIKEGRPRIDLLNYCADYLSCDSLDVDSQGVLVCTPYILPENRPVVWTFDDGLNCMFEDDFIVDSNADDIPTAIYVNASTNDMTIYATRYLPTSSPYSFQQRGRQVIAYFSHNDLPLIVGHAIVNKDCKLYTSKDTGSAVLQDMSKYDDVTVVVPQIEGDDWVQTRWNSTVGWTQSSNLSSQATIEKKADEYYSKIISLAISIEISTHFAPVHPGDCVRFIRGNTDIMGIVHAIDISELKEGAPMRIVIDVIGGGLGDVYP